MRTSCIDEHHFEYLEWHISKQHFPSCLAATKYHYMQVYDKRKIIWILFLCSNYPLLLLLIVPFLVSEFVLVISYLSFLMQANCSLVGRILLSLKDTERDNSSLNGENHGSISEEAHISQFLPTSRRIVQFSNGEVRAISLWIRLFYFLIDFPSLFHLLVRPRLGNTCDVSDSQYSTLH